MQNKWTNFSESVSRSVQLCLVYCEISYRLDEYAFLINCTIFN